MNFALGSTFAVLKTLRNHHKSKDYIFLHRSYVQFFSASTKNIFLLNPKKKLTKVEKHRNPVENRQFVEAEKIGHSFDVKNKIFRFMMFSARFGHSNPSIETITYFSSSVFFFVPISNESTLA